MRCARKTLAQRIRVREGVNGLPKIESLSSDHARQNFM